MIAALNKKLAAFQESIKEVENDLIERKRGVPDHLDRRTKAIVDDILEHVRHAPPKIRDSVVKLMDGYLELSRKRFNYKIAVSELPKSDAAYDC